MGDETLAKAKAEEPRLESFDALAHALVMCGAFLVAGTDLGYEHRQKWMDPEL